MHEWYLWAAGGSAVTVLAAGWRQVRSWLQFVRSFVVVKAELDTIYAAIIMGDYLTKHFKVSSFGGSVLDADIYFVRPLDRKAVVACNVVQGKRVFWQGWRPLWVEFSSSDDKNPANGKWRLKLSTVRGMYDLTQLFIAACDMRDSECHGDYDRFHIYHQSGSARKTYDSSRAMCNSVGDAPSKSHGEGQNGGKSPIQWAQEELGTDRVKGAAFDQLSLSPQLLRLAEDIRHWKASREWYRKRGIRWRFGCGLYGIPGTGKTSFVRALGQDLNLPIFVFDLTTFYNDELRSQWRSMQEQGPCIALIEEIDTAFCGREAKGDLTFDTLLNCIDGVDSNEGVLVIVTTNVPDKLDPALGQVDADGCASRPGRLDYIVEMGPPDREGLQRIAARILRDWPELIDETVAAGDGETGAQFEQRCNSLALRLYWSQKPSAREPVAVLEEAYGTVFDYRSAS